jgi:FdhD protein
MKATNKWKVRKLKGNDLSEVEDTVAEEKRLRISINGQEVLGLYCTPLMVRELVVGLIMTEGIAEGICTERMSIVYGDEISVDVPAEGKVRTGGASITSGCVGGITFSKQLTDTAKGEKTSIRRSELTELFRKFHTRSALYELTGCVHSAALSDGEDIICFAEDIGRHNAVDKAIGCSVLEAVDPRGKIMLASGRLSSEIVSKCARWAIPIVASRTAPTALALRIARETGVTVVGFVRGDRMNVYTHAHRVLGDED